MALRKFLEGGHPDQHREQALEHTRSAAHHARRTVSALGEGVKIWAAGSLFTVAAVLGESFLASNHMGGIYTTQNAEIVTGAGMELLSLGAGTMYAAVGGLIHLVEGITHGEQAVTEGIRSAVRTVIHPVEQKLTKPLHPDNE